MALQAYERIIMKKHCCIYAFVLITVLCGIVQSETVALKTDTIRDPSSQRILLYVVKPDTGQAHPCILFCPRFGTDDPVEYRELIHHIVSLGAVVVFPVYEVNVFTRHSVEVGPRTDDFFSLVSRVVKGKVDTTRIGFIGHSYGAGIIPAIAARVVDRNGWGSKGAFLYLMSPWYYPGTSSRTIANFPKSLHVIVQVFEDDNTNDPRIGANFFQMLKLPHNQKEFLVVPSTRSTPRIKSDFLAPLGVEALGGTVNIIDSAAIYRVITSAFEGVFSANTSAHSFVFGNGTTRSIPLRNPNDSSFAMIATDTPKSFLSFKPYVNSWISPRNPFIGVTRFRKARRMYVDFKRQKVQNLVSYTVDNVKRKSAPDESSIDILDNPIDTGFGASGRFSVHVDTIVDKRTNLSPAYFFRPAIDTVKQWPSVVLLHGYTGQEYAFFEPYISHLVSKGVAVLYPTFPKMPVASSASIVMEKMETVKAGIEVLYERFGALLDTTRVGVQGHSFGGGMVPYIALHLFSGRGWGGNGAYMFMTAPWYCNGLGDEEFKSFPAHTRMITMIFDEDNINDHAIAVDIHNSVRLEPENKNFITLFSDSIDGMVMQADHFVPYGTGYIYGQNNYLDYYGVYRFGDALAAFTFYESAEGKVIAMGNGNQHQSFMGKRLDGSLVRPARVSRTPVALHPQEDYFYAWDNPLNPRRDFRKESPDSAMKRLRLPRKN
jgi:dienelactone hydrolase